MTTTPIAEGTSTPTAQPASAPAAESQSAAPPAPAPRVFTQAEVDAIVQDRLARQKRPDVNAAPEPKPSQSDKSAPPPAAPAPSPDVFARMLEEDRAITRVVASANLSDVQEGILRALLPVEKPANVREWAMEKAKAFGSVQPATAAAAAPPQSTTMPPKPVVAPASSTPAPVSTVPSDQPDNPLNWTPEQLQSYRQQHYPYPENPGDPRNAAPRRLLAIKTRAQAAHLLIPLDRVNR
jgi:hypothetical protein